jgi:hypothetical protein
VNACKALYKEHGVHWSALWGLSDFDPTQSVVVDGMHNLFEGLVAYQCCIILGIDHPAPKLEEENEPDPHQLVSVMRIFVQGPKVRKGNHRGRLGF